MKHLILTTAIILGAAAPTFAGSANDHFIQELSRSSDGGDRFLARELQKRADASITSSVSSKSTPINSYFVEEFARSADGEDRFRAAQIASNGNTATTFVTSGITEHQLQELLRSEDSSDRFLAKELIKKGVVVQ